GLEQLGHTRKAAGDVLGLRSLARRLGHQGAGDDLVAFGHADVGAGRNRVVGNGFAVIVANDDLRVQIFLMFDDDHGLLAGGFIGFLLHRDVLDDVVELHTTGLLGENRHVVGVPLHKSLTLLDFGAVLDRDHRANNDEVLLQFASVVGEDRDGPVLVEDNVVAVLQGNQAKLVVTYGAIMLSPDLRHLENLGSSSADVEGPHGKLGARLADGLRGDDTRGFAQFDPGARGQVAAITISTHTVLALASQHGADFDFLNAGSIYQPRLDFVNLLVRLGKQFLRTLWVKDLIAREPTDEALAEFDDLVFTFVNGLDPDAVGRTAILLTNNYVLCHIHQLAGHVTRIGGLERSVGQTLAGSAGRCEILQHGEALAEVGENWFLNDVAGWFGHQPAHAGKLTDLLLVAARARINHERHRVVFLLTLVVLERLQHHAGDLVGAVRPDVNDLVVTFARSNDAFAILLLDLS